MAAESGQGGNGTILFGCRVPPGGLPRANPEPAAAPTAAIVMMSRPRQNTGGSQKEIYSVSTVEGGWGLPNPAPLPPPRR